MRLIKFAALTSLFCLMSFLSLPVLASGGFLALPVQDSGRVKPYDTFAREMLQLVYGKTVYYPAKAKDSDAQSGAASEIPPQGAAEVVFTWMLTPEAWKSEPIFEVKNHDVLMALKLDPKRRYFSGDELFGKTEFSSLRAELQQKRESKEKLSPYFQALQRLENQFFVFQGIASGEMLRVVPRADSETWQSVAELQEPFQGLFLAMTKVFIEKLGAIARKAPASEVSAIETRLNEAVQAFEVEAEKVNPEAYAHAKKVDIEILYNKIHPFRWAYVFYLISSLILLFVWITKNQKLSKLGWLFVFGGFIIHTAGFAVRIYLSERAPVSNMYETVIWVSWGGVLFSMILEKINRTQIMLLAGSLAALFSLIVADNAPAVLDPSLQPLEAVLRSNFWLTTHVMTITISYAAFMLAFVLGDIGLFYFAKGEEKNRKQIQDTVNGIYRSMQIGVAFLAPGIILGGVWADYSWGRFWGWDPKETWALIALLGYLAVLHGRLAGMIRQFGMVACGVITFSLVIMAWYGVNFVLGAGLHTYGFGAGGLEYVSAFVLMHFVFVAWVAFLRRGKSQREMQSS